MKNRYRLTSKDQQYFIEAHGDLSGLKLLKKIRRRNQEAYRYQRVHPVNQRFETDIPLNMRVFSCKLHLLNLKSTFTLLERL